MAAVVVVACVGAALGIAQAASGGSSSHSQAAHTAWMVAAGATGARWGWGKQMACGQHSFAARPLAAGTVQTVDQSAASFTLKTLRGVTVTVTTSASTTYRKRGLTSASLTDVTAGEFVVVMGTKASDGSLAASQVLISLAGFGSHSFAARPLAAGTVQTVDQSAASFTLKTLRGVTVTVTTSASTTYRSAASPPPR